MARQKNTKGETHGCIVCGKPYQLYVVYDDAGHFVDLQVMGFGGKKVPHDVRPLVSCNHHSEKQIEIAVQRAYGPKRDEDD